MQEQTDWYESAVDWWLGVLLVAVPLITVGALVAAIVAGEGWWLAALSCAFVAAVYLGLVWPVRYGLGETDLIVRFGVVRQRVAYSDIQRVRPTHNPLSSPALSLNRLRVETGEGLLQAVMISPARRDAFLDALAARTGLERHDDTLVRSSDPSP